MYMDKFARLRVDIIITIVIFYGQWFNGLYDYE